MSIVFSPVHNRNHRFSFRSQSAIYSYMNWIDLIEFRAPYQTAYFKGTNTRVLRVMLCLANGWTEPQILMMHPEINADHIAACLKYGESFSGPTADPQIDPQLVELVLNAQARKANAGEQPASHTLS